MTASDSDGTIVSWSLDIDNDGNAEYAGTGSPTTQAHTYTVAGTYTAKLAVADDGGSAAYDTEAITVSTPVEKYVEISIDGGEWQRAEGTHEWSYGWDSAAVDDGEHTIKARYFDGTALSPEDLITVNVHNEVPNEPPAAAFVYSPEDPKVRDAVQFTDLSSDPDGTIASWHWDFGDGAASTEKNPIHEYAAPGTFAVGLTVTGSDGATAYDEKTITVTPATPAKVTGLSAEPSNGKVLLSWDVPSDGGSPITGYNIYSGASSGALEYLATVSTTSYTDKEPAKGETWHYQVSAINGIGEGERSDELCVTASKMKENGAKSGSYASMAAAIPLVLSGSIGMLAICAIPLFALAVAACAIAFGRRKRK
ncbi:MAG: hypothetical protein CVT47_00565 [Thermoplasmata archaeon HGW-Thermoplasmata-2]|nr:MAG: hypothetical protein CVT47_00565 [Thermoplasmata archaeon HGW-Thermoplasmata-2]